MPRQHGTKTRVWVDGYNLTGDTTNMEVNATDDMAEAQAFGDTRKRYINGEQDVGAKQTGLFDSNAGTAAYEVLRSRIGSDVILSVLYGTPILSPGWGGTASPMANVGVSSPLAGAVTIAADYDGGPMHPMTALAGEGLNSGAQTGRDEGAFSLNGGVAVLQASGVTQAGTITVEHSTALASAYVPLIAFGNTTARTAVFGSASGSVSQYVRAIFGGSATAFVQWRRM